MSREDVKQEISPTSFHVVQGNAANMRFVRDSEVDLIITSPPYFPDDIERMLVKPKTEQNQYEDVEKRIIEFALTLRPIFKEIKRVLKPGCPFVMQTKDIRYGEFLIPLADVHQEMAVNSGLRLVTRFQWLNTPGSRKRLPRFARTKRRGDYRALDTESFMVFSHPEGLTRGSRINSISDDDAFDLIQPLWRLPQTRSSRSHLYGSPRKVVALLIELFTEAGSLVLDPFAGYGTTLVESKRLGRRAIGYDIESKCVSMTEDNLDRIDAGV